MSTCIFHVSDVHFGVENAAAHAAFARAVMEERPDAVLCTGDITQRAKHSEWAAAKEYFAKIGATGCPVILCAGNHDMPYYNMWERFSDPYRRYRDLANAVGGTLQSNDVILVPLKTTVRIQPRFPWSDGYVTGAALAETLEALERLSGDPRHKIIICHHPLLAEQDGAMNPTIGGDDAFTALAQAGGDAVASGHVHIPFDLTRERGGHSMRMLGVGTLSTRLRGAPPSYQVITAECGQPLRRELRELAPHTN